MRPQLIAALKQRLEDADGKNKVLIAGLETAASDAATLKGRLTDTEHTQERDDIKFDEIQAVSRIQVRASLSDVFV
jgi:vacuolar-type H+-ATPase subunit H